MGKTAANEAQDEAGERRMHSSLRSGSLALLEDETSDATEGQ